MKFPLSLKSSRLPKIGTLLFFPVVTLQACGPDFPNRYLDLPAETILAAPEGFFAVEIERLAPSPRQSSRHPADEPDTRESDDLRSALMERGDAADRVEGLVSAYTSFRCHQKNAAEKNETDGSNHVPGNLPEEFSLYLAGANAWYAGENDRARAAWHAVLSLPESKRHYRSTWAAYMLGRSASDEFPPGEARKWYVETRKLAAQGFADSLNLAGESFGTEARWALALQDYARAINFYLDQYATGDGSAYISLRMAAAAGAGGRDEQARREIAHDPRARCVVTAWFLARFAPGGELEKDTRLLCEWTETLERENIQDVDHADRLAWLAYESGNFELAKKWAHLALDASPETHWIRGKLALLENRICEGARELNNAATSPQLAPIYRSTLLGELGRAQLALDHREAALAAWLDGAHWEDAAYVAERLLTIDELKLFMGNYRPTDLPLYEPYLGEIVAPQTLNNPPEARDERDSHRSSLLVQLSELLARRMVRAGRIDDAKIYFSPKNRAVLAEYAAEVRSGFNLILRPKKRAEAFWRAAQIARNEGPTLMGAELDPDFGIWDGNFSSYGGVEARIKLPPGPFAVTREEMDRLTSIAIPSKRFSYRYRAADLAWWAASLLPNDQDETAEILNAAGIWLKARDPIEANRFYQALVIRCGHTKLGKAAAERHWFPPDI